MRDMGEEKKEETTGTLRKDKTLLRDDKKMEKLKQKLHTDDERTQAAHAPHRRQDRGRRLERPGSTPCPRPCV